MQVAGLAMAAALMPVPRTVRWEGNHGRFICGLGVCPRKAWGSQTRARQHPCREIRAGPDRTWDRRGFAGPAMLTNTRRWIPILLAIGVVPIQPASDRAFSDHGFGPDEVDQLILILDDFRRNADDFIDS